MGIFRTGVPRLAGGCRELAQRRLRLAGADGPWRGGSACSSGHAIASSVL